MLNLYAAHIVGGDVVYRCTSIDSVAKRTRFLVTFTMYRDSKGGGALFDQDANFGLFRSIDGSSWTHVSTFIADPKDIAEVTYDNPCVIVPPNIGVEKGVYEFTVDIPWSNETYQIAYQRCCRNGTITNIVGPGDTGAAFVVEIYPEAVTSCNNSPVFKKFPPIVVCIGEKLNFDHGATDSQADQLVYEFCAPLTAGGTAGQNGGDAEACNGVRPDPERCPPNFEEVSFLQPAYSFQDPLGVGNLNINPNTGVITGTPTQSGQYVVGVCVKEFRNGKLIGTIRRDFQFNVQICRIAVQADMDPDATRIETGYVEIVKNGEIFDVKSCGSKFIPFINTSKEERNIFGYEWTVNNGTSIDTFNTKNFEYTFPDFGKYSGKIILNPNLSNCSDSALINFEIFPEVIADFTFDYDTCLAGPITLEDLSVSGAGPIKSWKWDLDQGAEARTEDTFYEFKTPGEKPITLTVEDENGCIDLEEKIINYFPLPALIVIEPTQFTACAPASIKFENLSYPIDDSYILNWSFGDGGTSNEISPTHLYEDIGLFNLKLEIISPIGCRTEKTYNDWIEMLEKPIADFDYTPKALNNFNKTATFTNLSELEKAISWNFSDRGISFEEVATFTFPDTGIYNVTLIAFHENGCTDTALAIIDVMPLVNLDMPNAFTPNNDGLNDDFKGFGTLDGIKDYHLQIWNRWGEEIFESNDARQGWGGEYKGILAPQGVYVYKVNYISPRGEAKYLKGDFTLIR